MSHRQESPTVPVAIAVDTALTLPNGTARVDTTAGDVTVTLPEATVFLIGSHVELVRETGVSNSNALFVAPFAGQTINGSVSNVPVVGDYDSIVLRCVSATGWDIIAMSRSGEVFKVVSTDVDLTLDAWGYLVLADAGSIGSLTITLPTASGSEGNVIDVVRIDNDSTQTLTIDGNGAETINGVSAVVIYNQNDTVSIVAASATESFIAADCRPGDFVTSVSVDTTLTRWGQAVLVNVGGGVDVTITLPSVTAVDDTGSNAIGRQIRIQRADNNPDNKLIVSASPGDSIGNGSVYELYNQFHDVVLESDGVFQSFVVSEARRGDRVQTLTGNTTLTSWDQFVDADASAGSVTITLPAGNASDVTVMRATGRKICVRRVDNTPANTVTVAAAGGQTINSVASVQLFNQFDAVTIESTDETDVKIVSQVRPGDRVLAVTGNTTLTEWQETVMVDASGGAVTITLPSATVVGPTGLLPRGRRITVVKTDVSANYVTVASAGGQTIDTLTSFLLMGPDQALTVESDGSADVKIVSQYQQAVLNPTATKTGAYNAVLGELVRADPSGGIFTITLPALTTRVRRHIGVKNVTSSVTAITVAGNGAQTIDGAATITMTNGFEYAEFAPDASGTNWMRV